MIREYFKKIYKIYSSKYIYISVFISTLIVLYLFDENHILVKLVIFIGLILLFNFTFIRFEKKKSDKGSTKQVASYNSIPLNLKCCLQNYRHNVYQIIYHKIWQGYDGFSHAFIERFFSQAKFPLYVISYPVITFTKKIKGSCLAFCFLESQKQAQLLIIITTLYQNCQLLKY